MIELGEFSPASSLGPVKSSSTGLVTLGRLTTTVEQRQESIDWMLEQMRAHGASEGRATIKWSRLEPSVLIVKALIESRGDLKIWFPDEVQDQTIGGATIQETPEIRYERMRQEVNELAERKML